MVSNYPVQFDVDFPTRPLNRSTTAFRIFLAIPILILLGTLPSETLRSGNETTMKTMAIASGLVFLPLVLMIVFRQKYPRWWFRTSTSFASRIASPRIWPCSMIATRQPMRTRASTSTSLIRTFVR